MGGGAEGGGEAAVQIKMRLRQLKSGKDFFGIETDNPEIVTPEQFMTYINLLP